MITQETLNKVAQAWRREEGAWTMRTNVTHFEAVRCEPHLPMEDQNLEIHNLGPEEAIKAFEEFMALRDRECARKALEAFGVFGRDDNLEKDNG